MSDIIVSSGWRTRLEELVGSKRQTLFLVAGLVAAALVGLTVVGGNAPQVAPPAVSNVPAPAPASTPTTASTLFVHVSGAVRSPGLYELVQGSRVADAIDAARGASRGGQLDSLNLAELLADGMKVHVPVKGESATTPVPTGTLSPTATPIIDVNVADATMLETLPGIGPTRAAAIIAYRDEVGGFRSVDQLLEVQGIGPATLESMRDLVTV
jgi:competence protein ComEA